MTTNNRTISPSSQKARQPKNKAKNSHNKRNHYSTMMKIRTIYLSSQRKVPRKKVKNKSRQSHKKRYNLKYNLKSFPRKNRLPNQQILCSVQFMKSKKKTIQNYSAKITRLNPQSINLKKVKKK